MLADDPSPSSSDDDDARIAILLADRMIAGFRAEPAGAPRVIDCAGAPASEALSATRIAAAAVRELYEGGREVRFACVPTKERVAVLLCDVDGGVLSALTPATALDMATGGTWPQPRRR